jgi:DNA-binding transcriptional ArsR family regulator
MMFGMQSAATIARLLGDPVRLMILQALVRREASASELLAMTGTTQSNLSNHLKLLRENELVLAERQGRQIMYRIAAPAIAELVGALFLAVPTQENDREPSGPLAQARTCYDHLAGKLGVALLDGLVAKGALLLPEDGWTDLQLSPTATKTFEELGIDLDKEMQHGTRRRMAYCCADWSETGRAHIGGLVGAILCRHCQQMLWVKRDKSSRAVELTPSGENALGWLLR